MIDQILAELAAAPEAERPALARERFAGDPAMQAQVLAWLAAARAHAPDAPPALGDRYLLRARLGGGATASVWQAYDTKLGRQVAIKIFAHSPALAEVLAEARAACDVISDHVVRVLDVHDDAGAAYLVMELVGEHDLDRGELVAGGSAAVTPPRDVDEAVRWARDVARGVHAAHLRDVFHRDIKPANVLVAPGSRRARIADFGLAVSSAGGRGARIAGTPEVIAPEQARGQVGDDRGALIAADVWGLGALLYALVEGRPPWRGDADHDAWELAASGAPPPPISARKIPARLRRVIACAMALDPRARYRSAGALAAELDAYLARRPTSLDRSRPLRAWLWSLRNPQLAITALVAIALAIGTLATYLAVVRLRDERGALRVEMAAQESERGALEARAARTRKTLAITTDDLHRQTDALASLQRALAEGEREYQAIVLAKEKALRDADAATRALVGEVALAKADRDAAQFGRALYLGYWTVARSDADHAAKERDAAVAARAAAEKERDAATAARDAAEKELHDLEQRVEQQAHTEASAPATPVDAGVASGDADIRVTDAPPRHTPDPEGREGPPAGVTTDTIQR